MKKHIRMLCSLVLQKALACAQYLFGRDERRSTFMALLLTLAAPAAKAVDLTDMSNAADLICLIQGYVSGPLLFGIGIVLIIVAGLAVANSESTIGKVIGSVVAGLGVAACALPLVKNHLKINYTCA
ncbi:TrbC/VirB2 family protein [Burkholderia gladioli]|uniref:TrbC/VirB2 family protein n=1 Tax=Burkholderia gladioli TaxID=28095 RepID=UPI003D1BBDBB